MAEVMDSARTYVGIGEVAVSDNPDHEIVAANLGSCLGVAVYDPIRRVGGMVHCLLPLSSADPTKAKERPCLYVDTGVAYLLTKFLSGGSRKGDLIVKVAGGSQINDERAVFEIGKRNHQALRKILWKNNILLQGEDIGGMHSRTVSLRIANGDVIIRALGETKILGKER